MCFMINIYTARSCEDNQQQQPIPPTTTQTPNNNLPLAQELNEEDCHDALLLICTLFLNNADLCGE